ncbi:class I SAM-dependent methyltransferase [Nocardioides terrisoli]|uniref:class I SAM-dependent methyltransferase n=1 Tax=Nocardioides terrisoli TaxID=3388267 RepID=UPI00287BA3D3|nr:class I SAM-dependent methyltransferase [Nocardioides marmorisolisilvae]
MNNPVFARFYSNVVARGLERGGGPGLRARLLDGLAGTVVEVGAGDGANFRHYPAEVTRVVAVEPEPYLRRRAVASAPHRVEVVDGDAADLPLPDAAADAVVFCLVLCSVDDLPAALAEAARVLRPGGELRLFEHVRAHRPGVLRHVQDALDATVWPRLFGGCHCGRDIAAQVEEAGFTFSELDRFSVPRGSRMPMSPAILGRARRVLPAR